MEFCHVCDINVESLVVDASILGTLWVLKSLRVHQSTKRTVNLDNWHSCLVNVVDMHNPAKLHLFTEPI